MHGVHLSLENHRKKSATGTDIAIFVSACERNYNFLVLIIVIAIYQERLRCVYSSIPMDSNFV